MLETIFKGLFDSETAAIISIGDFLLCLTASLILGLVMALCIYVSHTLHKKLCYYAGFVARGGLRCYYAGQR